MNIEDFKPLNGECRSLLKRLLPADPESCERSWVNLLLYCDSYSWRWFFDGKYLWIASFEEAYSFFPPSENCPPEVVKNFLSGFARLCGDPAAVCGDLPWNYRELFPQASDYLVFKDDPGDYDYIYNLHHQQSFSGSKLRKRHNQVRQFDREYDGIYTAGAVALSDLPEIMQLSARLSGAYWNDASGAEERLALARLAEHWLDDSLELDGVVLKVNGQLAGFSIFSCLNSLLVDIHFEKADRNFCGCGAKLTSVLVEYLLSKGYSFMNREQDLNLEGLRRAKQALDPDRLYRRVSAFLPGN